MSILRNGLRYVTGDISPKGFRAITFIPPRSIVPALAGYCNPDVARRLNVSRTTVQ